MRRAVAAAILHVMAPDSLPAAPAPQRQGEEPFRRRLSAIMQAGGAVLLLGSPVRCERGEVLDVAPGWPAVSGGGPNA